MSGSVSTMTTYEQARARWRERKAAQQPATPPAAIDPTQPLPEALQADLDALHAAGLRFTVLSISPAPPPQAPSREITADEIAHLDAADPMRTLHQYQRYYSQRGQPMPQHLIAALRIAAADSQKKRRR